KLKAEQAGSGTNDRVLYRFPLENVLLLQKIKLPASLWCPDDHILIFSLTESALRAVPDSPHPNGEQLASELRAALTQRIEDGAVAWLAGHVDDWQKTALPGLLASPDTPLRNELLAVHTFAASLVFERSALTLRAALQCLDEDGAQRLEKLLMRPANE